MGLTIEHEAYCVAYLHISRYSSKAVNGVLVGSVEGSGVTARKAFPLFHAAGALALAPMLEAALMLVRHPSYPCRPPRRRCTRLQFRCRCTLLSEPPIFVPRSG